MAEQLRVFVSHSHKDNKFCHQIVQALRDAGADVWYDEHDMTSGRLGPTIERELRSRPVFVVILSPAALRSQWVEDETRWAYGLLRKDPSRIMQPITGATIQEDDIWLFLHDFKRIEAPSYKPYPAAETARRLLRILGLTPTGEAPAPVAPQPTEDVDDLVTRGKALAAQKQYAEALPLFDRAAQFAPGSVDAWANLGYIFNSLGRYAEALTSYNRVLALDPNIALAWYNKGVVLSHLEYREEALFAYDQALALDSKDAKTWNNKGNALNGLGRDQEALIAFDRALALNPSDAVVWNNKGNALNGLGRHEEALAACKEALTLDPNYAAAWYNKGNALNGLGRYQEALAAYDRAVALDPKAALAWYNKAISLRALGRTTEAGAAEKRAKKLGWKG